MVSTNPSWEPLSPCSCLEISSIILFVLAVLVGIGSFSSTVVAWNYDDDYYYDDDCYDCLPPATIAALSQGGLFMLLAIVSFPLTYCAARGYLHKRNATGSMNGPCMIGYVIAAWIIYGLYIASGLSAIGLGAAGGDVTPGWVAALVVWFCIGWACMITYAELARRRQSGTAHFSSSTNPAFSGPPHPNPSVPVAYPEAPNGVVLQAQAVQPTQVTKTITRNSDGTTTETKTTRYSDGTEMEEITDYPTNYDMEANKI